MYEVNTSAICFTVPVPDPVLKKLSRELPKQTIKEMAVEHLGLKEVDVQNKEEENPNARNFIYELLKLWKSKNLEKGTVEALRNIFRSAAADDVSVPEGVFNVLKD